MASCSLFTPNSYPLLSRSELESLLLFERVDMDWVREVHMYSSMKKKGKNFVVFRNRNNKKVLGLKNLKTHLEQQGLNLSVLENANFKSDKEAKVVSNKVGSNKIAKREALDWIKHVTDNTVAAM